MACGQRPVLKGEFVCLRILVKQSAFGQLPELLAGMSADETYGEFSSDSLVPVFVRDAISRANLWADGVATGFLPSAFTESLLVEEISALQSMPAWTLQFVSPLRLPLPAGSPDRGQHKYMSRRHFEQPGALPNLISRVRGFEKAFDLGASLCIDAMRIYWEDMRYNRLKCKALGGITGSLRCKGRMDAESALRLVSGQYLGAGKNPRFGLGFWRIPELDQIRRISLPDYLEFGRRCRGHSFRG